MTSWCCMCRCRCNGEMVDHLMLHCPLAVVLWNFFFWVFDVHWVVSGCVMDMLFGWRNWFGKHYLEVWNLVPLCLMWTIWGEQNQRIFEDKANSQSQLVDCFSTSLFDWSRTWVFTFSTFVIHFIDSLSLVPHSSTLVITQPSCVHTLCTWSGSSFINIYIFYLYKKNKNNE